MLLICQTFAPLLRKGVTLSTYSFNERESAVHEDVPDKMLLFLFGDRFKAIFTLYRITISSQNERLCGLPHSMNSNGTDQEQVPHSHQSTSGTFGREGLVNCLPALAPKLPS